MSTALKRVVSILLVLFVLAASFVAMPPVSASAVSQVKYSVSYSGNYVYLKLTPRKSTNKIYYTTNGKEATRKSTRYKKTLAAKSMTFIRATEYNKKNQKVAVLNIIVKPRVKRPRASVTASGSTLYVKLTSGTAGAKIYYTTDGSKPTKKSKLYTSAIKCKAGTVIRARAYKVNMNTSKITKYTVKKPNNTTASDTSDRNNVSDDNDDLTFNIDFNIDDLFDDDDYDDYDDDTDYEPEPVQSSESDIDGVFRIMNEERAKAGVPKLTLDTGLCTTAAVRAKELVSKFAHYRPDGRDCFTALDEYGIRYMAAGENIAAGQTDAEDVMNSWMNSPGHRGNILSSSFGRVGIGCYKSGGMKYWVQMFTD